MAPRKKARTLPTPTVRRSARKKSSSELETAGRSTPSSSSARPSPRDKSTPTPTPAPRKRVLRNSRRDSTRSSTLTASPVKTQLSSPLTSLAPSPRKIAASPPLSSLPASPLKPFRPRSPLPPDSSSLLIVEGHLPSRRRHYQWEIDSDHSDPVQDVEDINVFISRMANEEPSPPEGTAIDPSVDANHAENMIFSDEERPPNEELDAAQSVLARKRKQVEARDAFPLNEGTGSVCYIKTVGGGYLPGYIQSVIPLEERRSGYCCIAVTRLGKTRKYRRSDILFPEDPAFATCALATWVWRPPVFFHNDAHNRQPTPPPDSEPALTLGDFAKADRVIQLRHIRPHLQRIILGEYQPAMWRINLFFDCNQNALLQMVRYGNISEHEVGDVILPELERWALRADRWLEYPEDTAPANRGEEPARPTGSQLYEQLSPKRRRDFIADVLLPEAIIQLRIVGDGLSQEAADEAETYSKAVERMSETNVESQDDALAWDLRTATLSFARRREREKRGLYPDHFNREEIEEWEAARDEQRKVLKSTRGRKLKKKVDYFE